MPRFVRWHPDQPADGFFAGSKNTAAAGAKRYAGLVPSTSGSGLLSVFLASTSALGLPGLDLISAKCGLCLLWTLPYDVVAWTGTRDVTARRDESIR
jgi:hypothetical protein